MTITNPTRGIVSSEDLTTGVIVNMDEMIYFISPNDAPLTTGVDSDGYQVLPRLGVDQIEFSWQDEERLTPVDALNGAVLTSDTTWTVDNGAKFQVGDIVGADGYDEIVQVTAISGNDLTVTRSFGSAAADVTADNTVLRILGTVLAEGSDPGTARSADRTKRTNYLQIHGPDAVHMSRTQRGIRRYGVGDEYAHQLANRTVEMTQRIEQNILYGDRVAPSGNGIRTSGGFDYWITSNVDSSSTALTPTLVETQMQACYDKGGVPDMLTAAPVTMKDLNDIADTNIVRVQIDDPRRGRQRAHMLLTEFGDVMLVRNRFCSPTDAFLWTQGQAIRRVFDPIIYELLAKTGDSMKGQIVCEEGLQFKGEQHAAKFNALT